LKREGYLLIGKITGPHGIKGLLKVHSYAESLDLFAPDEPIFLKRGKDYEPCTVLSASPHKKGVLLLLEGITDRNRAEAICGVEIYVEKSRLPELEEDVYYWDDLIGLSVEDEDGSVLGSLTSIIETGSNDVYVVQKGKEEILIPALEHVILSVDLETGLMRVCLPEGLL
jgi:16S rRNA processing protein RimM